MVGQMNNRKEVNIILNAIFKPNENNIALLYFVLLCKMKRVNNHIAIDS